VVFPGINEYIDAATSDPRTRGDARDDPGLQTAADLIGQAYRNPANAAGILDAAAFHVASLAIRAKVAGEVLAAARADLMVQPIKPITKPVKPGA
jgi:hypothetical protein